MFKLLIIAVTLLTTPQFLLAEVILHEPVQTYEATALDVTEPNITVLGELTGEPHLFELNLESSTKLNITLRQSASGEPVLLNWLLINVPGPNLGVTAVDRLISRVEDWQLVEDDLLGLSFWHLNPALELELEPGQYRYEISSAENYGQYLVRFELDPAVPAAYSWLELVTIRDFFGLSAWTIVFLPRVGWPLMFLVAVVLGLSWWLRRRRARSYD